ncbi:MAG: hypothetical protein KAZ87_14055 [Spirochaetes bacterium]|nr:hypothetical protein [Spirochaetota bacterium]
MKKIKKAFMIQLFLILFTVSCSVGWSGDVVFVVEGSISDVDIRYSIDNDYEGISSVTLPWQSDAISISVEDGDKYNCSISVENNTADSSPIKVKIFVDGVLRAEETASSAYCSVSTEYTIDEFE